MGPNLQCPIHGTRENLHAGVINHRRDMANLRGTHDAMLEATRVIREALEEDVRKWKKIAEDSIDHPFTDPNRTNYQSR